MGLGPNLSGDLSGCLLVRACAEGCPQRVELCDWALCFADWGREEGRSKVFAPLISVGSGGAPREGRGVGVGEGVGLPSA